MQLNIITKLLISSMISTPMLAFADDERNEKESENARQLEVITITAQKRTESVKDVPLSVATINREALENMNISNTEELSSRIGNFSVSQSGQGFNIYMRGLGSGPNQGFEQTVGTYVDGIYRGRGHLMRSTFLDLEMVEVLRGPQGTLFGMNTTAGALNLTTASPTDYFSGYLNTSYDMTYDGLTFEGAVSGPLADTLQARFAFRAVDSDGYMKNIITDESEVQHETLLGRLSLAWQPTDKLSIDLKLQQDKDEFTGDSNTKGILEPALAAANPDLAASLVDYGVSLISAKTTPSIGEVEGGEFTASHQTLKIEYELGDHTLSAISGWQSYEVDTSNDGDRTPRPLLYRSVSDEEYSQFSQELRLMSPGHERFNYILGAYYQDSDLTYDEHFLAYALQFDGVRQFRTQSEVMSAFGKFDWNLDEQWSVSLGLRYTHEEKDGSRDLTLIDLLSGDPISQVPLISPPALQGALDKFDLPGISGAVYSLMLGPDYPYLDPLLLGSNTQNIVNPIYRTGEDHSISAQRTEESFTPALSLKYQIDDAMFYVSIAKGAKSGGFDARANLPENFEFDDESVLSYELGSKLTLDGGAADLNLALFYMEFSDLQTSTFDGSTGFYVENGAKATSFGLELDGRWAFADDWLWSGSLGLLDFSWDEFTGAKCFTSLSQTSDLVEANGSSCDLSGQPNALSPKVSGSTWLEYRTELSSDYDIRLMAETVFKSSYFTNADLNPYTEQAAFAKYNAQIALINTDSDWQLGLILKNLSDEITINSSYDMPFTPGGYVVYTEPGRSATLQFSYKFE
ncbi:TonB-dependent receptor [Shewanella sp.]|uniref:TonB-dependent receptor n=1 Tax=Shewanella sp. TaxID=50422 RepID=UPI00258C7E8A|nr:TonB-dependent receptor [Shewanella sp.]MCJ8301101.1 TonB-dependent receptor [Shewanella sp.]